MKLYVLEEVGKRCLVSAQHNPAGTIGAGLARLTLLVSGGSEKGRGVYGVRVIIVDAEDARNRRREVLQL